MSLPDSAWFSEQVGSTFEVVDISPPLKLQLSKVIEHAKTETHEAFSVFFLSPTEHFMPQGTRKISHVQFGEREIFLVPVARTSVGFEYEAVFNYILSESIKEKQYG